MSPLLSMRGIARTFEVPDSPPLQILTNVDLDVAAGEHVAVVGRSGTGKSTLLNLIGLIDQPTEGTYTVDGRDTRRLSEARRAHLRGQTFSFVFQSFNLIEGLSTTENVAAPLLYDTGSAFWTRTRRAEELLASVGLEDKLGSPIGRLSGGEQQRVAIARALAKNPKLLLCDEPTGALDYRTGKAILRLLQTTCYDTGKTVVLITHNSAFTAIADRVIHVREGRADRVEVNEHPVSAETLEW